LEEEDHLEGLAEPQEEDQEDQEDQEDLGNLAWLNHNNQYNQQPMLKPWEHFPKSMLVTEPRQMTS
jgi:hypothetical protein